MQLLKHAALSALVLAMAASTASAGPKPSDMDFEPDNASSSPPSKDLELAIKMYDKRDYESASIEFKKVLAGETQDDAKNKQRAEFFMGKTLYQMGYYAASMGYFHNIVKQGDNHTYHGATLKWLAALSRVLPEGSGILDEIGKYDPSALNDASLTSVKDELLFLLGKNFYTHGDFDKAVALFQQVSKQSEFYIKAKFFEGVTYVRQYQGKPAVDAFKDILIIGEEQPKQYSVDDIADYRSLAQLQMARVFYSTQQYDTSIKYFEKLPQASEDWAESLFEASWAYFMKTLNSKALGNIHTLDSPYFENEFYPESELLRAVIYFNYCLYDRAEEAIADFNEKYTPLTKTLKDILAKTDDNAEFYDYIKKIKGNQAGLEPVAQRLVMSVLDDKQLLKTFAWVDELNHELAMLNKASKSWQSTQVAAETLQDLTVQQSTGAGLAGKLARERIDRLARELGALQRDGIKIKFEILQGQEDKISSDATAASGRVSATHKEEPIIVDDEHFQWKFNGEYWKDELGYYRFKIQSRCPKSANNIQ